MSAEIIPIKHDWATHLDKNVILVKHSFVTNDFGIVNAIIADEQLSGIDHLATFHNHVQRLQLDQGLHDVPEQLIGINAQAVQSGLDFYQEFHNKVGKLTENPGPTPYAASWEDEINDAAEKAKDAATSLLDQATNAAKDVIGKITDGAQEVASKVFGSGFKAVHVFLGNVWSQIRNVVQNPVAALKKGWDHVKSAAQTAWNWFKGAFSYSATLPGTVSGHDEGSQSALLGQSASLGSHVAKQGHSHSATHGGGSHQAKKPTGK